MRSEIKPTLETGHLHVPILQDQESEEDFSNDKTKALIDTIIEILNLYGS